MSLPTYSCSVDGRRLGRLLLYELFASVRFSLSSEVLNWKGRAKRQTPAGWLRWLSSPEYCEQYALRYESLPPGCDASAFFTAGTVLLPPSTHTNAVPSLQRCRGSCVQPPANKSHQASHLEPCCTQPDFGSTPTTSSGNLEWNIHPSTHLTQHRCCRPQIQKPTA